MAFLSQITKHFNTTLALSCLLVAVSQFNYGFDNQAFSTTQAMTAFDRQFGVYNAKKKTWEIPSYFLSLLNSLNYIGFAIGLVVGSMISARFGRRVCIFTMSCYALITATITVTSQAKEQILIARILNYIYVGMELAVVPLYQSEIVPSPVRGLVVGTYQLSLLFGGFIINSVCKGTSTISSNAAWRIPFGLFYIIPTIVLSLVYFIPESPRWLLTRDRPEDARVALHRLRKGVRTEDEIDQELNDLSRALASVPEQGRFIELFQGSTLKRTMIVIFINFFQQATGQAFASQYGAVFVKSLGTINTFSVTLWNSGINIIIISACLLLVDKVGRRPLLITGSIIQTAALFTMAGLGVQTPVSIERKSGIVAMITIFGTGFSIGWAALTYVVTTEVIPLRLRDHGQRVASLVNILMNFVVTFTLPYLLNAPYADLQSKVGFIFGSLALLSLVFAYFFVPDCQGKSLEEIDQLFHQGVSMRDFKSAQAQILEEDHPGTLSVLAEKQSK